jgi:glucose-6-phosphate isomerase
MMEKSVVAALEALRAHSAEVTRHSVADGFAADPQRFAAMHVLLDDLLFDFSKQRIDAAIRPLFTSLAKAADIEGKRAAMFAGKLINSTERRAACAIFPASRSWSRAGT